MLARPLSRAPSRSHLVQGRRCRGVYAESASGLRCFECAFTARWTEQQPHNAADQRSPGPRGDAEPTLPRASSVSRRPDSAAAPPAPRPARGRLRVPPVRRHGAWRFSMPAVATPIRITHDYSGPCPAAIYAAPLLWAARDAVALHGPRGRRQSSLTGSVITEVVKSS